MIENKEVFIGTDCDFCQGGVTEFKKVYDQWAQSWWLEGLNGSGSDNLATWCKDCGPKHKKDEQGDRIKERWAEAQNEFMTLSEFEDIFEDRDPFEFL